MAKVGGAISEARRMFESKSSRGQSSAKSTKDWKQHSGAITGCRITPAGLGATFSTSGMDGCLVKWDIGALDRDLAVLAE